VAALVTLTRGEEKKKGQRRRPVIVEDDDDDIPYPKNFAGDDADEDIPYPKNFATPENRGVKPANAARVSAPPAAARTPMPAPWRFEDIETNAAPFFQ